MYSPVSSTTSLKRSHRYRPASEAEDVSRLLDPWYATGSSGSEDGDDEIAVYVDSRGELHDPSFRPFPALDHLMQMPHNQAWRARHTVRRAPVADDDEVEAFLRERECGCNHAYACARPCDCARSVCSAAARRSPPPDAVEQRHVAFSPCSSKKRKASFSSAFTRKTRSSTSSSDFSLDSHTSHWSSSTESLRVPEVSRAEEVGEADFMMSTEDDEEPDVDDAKSSDRASSPRPGGSSRFGWQSSTSLSDQVRQQAQDPAAPREPLATNHGDPATLR
ncbi:hypothetical protein BD626DRAFT_599108 [Schizophyllum amplum]|uniref:Uncharacterized protein n=1 Tax=Schizophyllum amplum TaxID=97359 RepID=A0A550C8T5_9AGAR|nr:hypothetical protein BD626DRAFT_599108 [Auriculariopsis ampla]